MSSRFLILSGALMARQNGSLDYLTEDFSLRGMNLTLDQVYAIMRQLPDVSPQKHTVFIDKSTCYQLANGSSKPYDDLIKKGWVMEPYPFLILKPVPGDPNMPLD